MNSYMFNGNFLQPTGMEYRCLSCQNVHIQDRYCNKCYMKMYENGANSTKEAEKKLKRKIEDLEKANKEAHFWIEDLKKCNGEANHRIEHLKKCNEEANHRIKLLNSSLTFLRSSTIASPPPLTGVVLVASDDASTLSISANRAILASRSPVFRAMLENKMEESISGIIKIDQVSNDTLGMFINILYTAEAVLDDKMACDLLMLGDQYQIPHLKTYCERFLSSSLTWEKSLPIYAFARQHNSRRLQDASLSLILKDIRKLSQRQDYAKYAKRDPSTVLEIFEAYKF